MPILDVRSPSEYAAGHVPGGISLPLFSDDERAQVGICYKEHGPEKAIRLGLSLVGPKMADLVAQADALGQGEPLEVYCWRGGMRSQSMAWLLNTAGHSVCRWEGGYKAYRRRVHESWFQSRPWVVLSALTGSGKTEILRAMREMAAPVFDLEGLAQHKGSAFGHIGESHQPNTEQFENNGAVCLDSLPANAAIWMEDESRSIGRIWLQNPFFDLKKAAPLVVIVRSRANRLDHLVDLYGKDSTRELSDVFPKIAKRLGHQTTQWALDALNAGDLRSAADLALKYYDRTYGESLEKRKDSILATINVTDLTFEDAAAHILEETQPILHTWLKQRP